MTVLDAEEALKHPVPDSRVYDVVLAATGDEEAAWSARNERIMTRLKNRETPDL